MESFGGALKVMERATDEGGRFFSSTKPVYVAVVGFGDVDKARFCSALKFPPTESVEEKLKRINAMPEDELLKWRSAEAEGRRSSG